MSATTFPSENSSFLTPGTRPSGAIPRRSLLSWPLLLIVLVGAALLWRYDVTLRADRDSVAHAETVILATASVGIQEDEAEAAERGYVLTGDPTFLAALQLASESLPGTAARVRRLVGADPTQADRAATLESLVARRTEQMMHAVEIRRNQGPRAARDYALRTDVRNTDRRLRDVLAEIAAAERAMLTGRQDRVRAMGWLLLAVGVLTAVLAFGAEAVVRCVRRRRVIARGEPAPATA